MNSSASEDREPDFRRVAAVMAIAIAMLALTAVFYLLIDIFLLLFLGIVVAAALQPWHVKLCGLGIPRGVAVLLMYLLLVVALVLVGVVVGPPLVEQGTAFASSFPAKYAEGVALLRESRMEILRMIGRRMPSYGVLVTTIAGVAPNFYQSLVDFTAGLITAFGYLVTIFAVGFYWTIELPRWERLVLSLVPVTRRAQVLNIWHEIEFKLGAFIRGQALAMLAIAVASAIGYVMIGLPNVLALALLAGLLEAVPLLGPLLAAVPAVLVALPFGLTTVLLVIGWSLFLQGVENNVLIPRIMSRAVGVSALVSLLAILAFGMLYGIFGIFIAIPMTAVVQVLVDRIVVNAEAAPVADSLITPLEHLRARVYAVQQQARQRLRERDTRMGIDPSPDHVVDALDEQIEKAAERVTTLITAVQQIPGEPDPAERVGILQSLREVTERIEQAVTRTHVAQEEATNPCESKAEVENEPGPSESGPLQESELTTIVEDLDEATQQVKDAVEHGVGNKDR